MSIVVRMARAGNGVPVFTAEGRSMELKRPFGATYDSTRALWMYPAYYPVAQRVLNDFQVLSHDQPVTFSTNAQDYIKELQERENKYKNRELPEGFEFVTKPFDHQVLGLCHAYYMPRSALFYDPGLGKSKIAVDLMRLLRFTGYKGPFLIMGPLVTIRNWGKEIDRHSGSSLTWGAVLGTVAKKKKVIEQAAAGEFDALLITYDTARNFVEQLHETVPYNVVIADESHLIKDYKAARTKAALEIVQKAGRRLIMTGTPTLGNPLDLYGQFKFLGDYFMPENWHHYRNVFLNLSPYNKHLVLGYKNLKLLNERTVFLSLRKTKAECLDLPPQTFVDVDVELSTGQIQAANTLITEMGLSVAQIEEHLDGAANNDAASLGFLQLPHVATLLIKLLQINAGFLITPTTDPQFCDNAEPGGCRHIQKCVPLGVKPYTGGCAVVQEKPEDKIEIFKENPKLDALSELLDTLLGGPDNKVIVWCYFQAEMNIVAKRLEEAGIGYVRVDGKTGSKAQTYIDQFNTDPEKRVYLGQISTGVGITLNAANYMVYYSLTFSLGVYLQSLDRNYRIGQSKNVTVYRLLAKRTIEPTMMRLLENKVDVDAALTKAGQSINNLVRVVTRPREL